MTANGLISEALGLQFSHFLLHENYKKALITNIDRKPIIIAGLSQSSSIILSFALEIALKGLLKHRFNKFPKTHDLLKLYDKLDKNDRDKISNLFSKKTNTDIEECLKRHKDMFMEFRYFEIEIDEPNNNENVNVAIDSVINFYNQIKDKHI